MPDIVVPTPCATCTPVLCPNAFNRVVVSYLIAGGSTVFWELSPNFTDPRPYTFQLQVGQSDNPEADDWQDVGAPVIDTFIAVDGEQRIYGKIRWLFYRVKLTTTKGVYYSDPTGLLGVLDFRAWRLARDQLRQEIVYMRNGDGNLGYLLKRRVAGQPCRHCLDPGTLEVRNPYCPVCYGTGFECGYFFPIGCVWAQLSPRTSHTDIDATRGTINDVVISGRMANIWMLSEEDIWIDKAADERYYVHKVQNLTEYRGVPIAADVELRPAPYSDPVYTLDIPQQLESLGQLRLTAG